MLALPLSDSPLRNLFSVSDLVVLGTAEGRKVHGVTVRNAEMSAKKLFSDKAVKSVHSLCMDSLGNILLMKFGPRGGRKILWVFGKP